VQKPKKPPFYGQFFFPKKTPCEDRISRREEKKIEEQTAKMPDLFPTPCGFFKYKTE